MVIKKKSVNESIKNRLFKMLAIIPNQSQFYNYKTGKRGANHEDFKDFGGLRTNEGKRTKWGGVHAFFIRTVL